MQFLEFKELESFVGAENLRLDLSDQEFLRLHLDQHKAVYFNSPIPEEDTGFLEREFKKWIPE